MDLKGSNSNSLGIQNRVPGKRIKLLGQWTTSKLCSCCFVGLCYYFISVRKIMYYGCLKSEKSSLKHTLQLLKKWNKVFMLVSYIKKKTSKKIKKKKQYNFLQKCWFNYKCRTVQPSSKTTKILFLYLKYAQLVHEFCALIYKA